MSLRNWLEQWITRAWYPEAAQSGPQLRWLAPLSTIYAAITALRRNLYQSGWLKSHAAAVPVLVVGNITTGGTGKTPLLIALYHHLTALGLRPGILSRGYGGSGPFPALVSAASSAHTVGDEPKMIFDQTGAPVVVSPDRVQGIRLLEQAGVNIVLCDDGLQHYRLQRNLEWVVIDAFKQLGNGFLLPRGPLRESPEMLKGRTLVNNYGTPASDMAGDMPGCGFIIIPGIPYALNGSTADGHQWMSELTRPEIKKIALTAIGNPDRFIRTLHTLSVYPDAHLCFPDHHPYTVADIPDQPDTIIFTTEKDAVKLKTLPLSPAIRIVVVPVVAQLSVVLQQTLADQLQALGADL